MGVTLHPKLVTTTAKQTQKTEQKNPIAAPAASSPAPPSAKESDLFVGVTTTKAQQAAAVDAPLPKRRLPSLRAAMVDATIPPISLAQIPVPKDVVSALANAKRILVIGHANPADGDCVGSALALKHGLQGLGKDVVAVVDQVLPRHLRAVDGKGELRRASDDDVTKGGFDLVVLVDVAQSHRIGDMASVVQSAPHVLVLDHHDEPHVETSAGAGDDAQLTSWINVDFDAAAVQVGAAVAAVAKQLGKDEAAAIASCSFDVAAGLYTDTLGATAPGTSAASLGVLKGVLGDVTKLDALEHTLRAPLPDAVTQLIDASISQRGKSVLVVDDAKLNEALQALQQTEPQAVLGDVTGRIMNALDALAKKASGGHAMLILNDGDQLRVSIRGPDALALQKKLSHDGGGKPGAAVAMMTGDVEAAAKKAQKALSEQQSLDEARLRLGR